MFKQSRPFPGANAGGSRSGSASLTEDLLEARQETQIWTAYALSRYLRANDIKVTVRSGMATLTGIVVEDANRNLAEQIALGVDGIRSVENRITIVPSYIPMAPGQPRSFGDIVDDASVMSAVKSKLAWSRFADGLIADVSVARGRVKLMGTVTDAETRVAAERLAMTTVGVHSVSNQLVIRNNQSHVVTGIGADFADGWITLKVKSTFMYSNHVAGSTFEVSTRLGVVKLTGKIDSDVELATAVELAGYVRGVKSVDSSALMH